MGVKIQNHLERMKKKEVAQIIGDAFYTQEFEEGIPFYARRTNVLRDMKVQKKDGEATVINVNKTINIPDEMLQRQQELKMTANEEAKRDRTYEEFEAMYGDHLAGLIDPQSRVGGRPDTANFEDGGGSRANKTGLSHNAMEEDHDARESRKTMSKKDTKTIDSQRKISQASSVASGDGKQLYQYDLPNTCKMEILKMNRIERLEEEYVLVVHPFPQMEGEMLLFQTIGSDQEDKDLIVYKDYSLRKRINTPAKPARMSAFLKKQMLEDDQEKTQLQCLAIDIETSLSTVDWTHFSQVITEVQGMGWFQILPVGCKSSQPFQFNMMHILPSSKIPFAKVPLDMMISNKLTFLKKKGKQEKEGTIKKIHEAVHPNEKEAAEMGLLLIDEYRFDHAIFQLGVGEFTAEGLQYGYKKLFNFLGLHKKLNSGLTVIITQRWMFMSVVHQPYHRESTIDLPEAHQDGGVPVYLDGFAFSGILNLQDIV